MIVVRRVKHKESIASFSGGHWDWDKDVWVEDPKYSQTNPKTVPKPGRSNSKAVLAGLAAAGLVGAGAYFIRRRRSSKGKQIIERVRR
jgi:LPXTG-motif cell wall-anchored protein